jgi:16S rRNA (uracil1498-N3)-methyltransferase
VRKSSSNTVEKFEKIAIAAIKQCDNAFLPKINNCNDIKELVQILKVKNYLPAVALEFGEHKLISEIVTDLHKPVCLIVGPEGGFTKEEAEYFLENGVTPFALGNHILRAETAAITAASQLLAVNLKQDPKYY